MNDILQLKGNFEQVPNETRPGGRNIPKNSSAVTSDDLRKLLDSLKSVRNFWSDKRVIENCLIDARYVGIVAKSNRIGGFLYASPHPNEFVRGHDLKALVTKRENMSLPIMSVVKHSISLLIELKSV